MGNLEGADLPTCQVCGEPVAEGLAVHCTRCATAHHRDCWNFNGRCSTYGCGGSTFAGGLSDGPATSAPLLVIDERTVPPPQVKAKLMRPASAGGAGMGLGGWLAVSCLAAVVAISSGGETGPARRVAPQAPRYQAPVRAEVVCEVGRFLQRHDVRDVAFLSPTKAIACLADGEYFMDAEGSWLPLRLPSQRNDFWAVHFLPGAVAGWLAGRSGGLLATNDGGATWERRNVAEVDFVDVFFVSAQRGFALQFVHGGRAHVMATVDGGRSWRRCAGSDDVEGRAVRLWFLDERVGFLASAAGYLYQTQDAGSSFTRVGPWFGRSLHGVCAWPDGRVAAAGDGPHLLLRTAGGAWCMSSPFPHMSWVRGLAVKDEQSFLVAERGSCIHVRWMPVPVERGP